MSTQIQWAAVLFWLSLRCLSGASLDINLVPKVSGENLQADSLRYQNSAEENFSITRVSFLLSGFALQRKDGVWLELTNEVAWFDLESNRLSCHLAAVPSDEYQGIRFFVGLDGDLNHADPAQFGAGHPLNPNLNHLHWSWRGGYIFLALEGMWRNPNGVLNGWSYHFARDANRTCVSIPVVLHVTNDVALSLDFDLAALLNAPRPLTFGKDGSSTHSRDGDLIVGALAANLPGAFRVRQIGLKSVELSVGDIKPLFMPTKFTPYRFQMNSTFPMPALPKDNPLIEERVVLGEKLFNDTALSRDGMVSCASCHSPSEAFSDSRRYSIGVAGRVGVRNSMPLQNLAWKSSFFWDGRATALREQALMPIQDHAEMDENLSNVVNKLSGTIDYRGAFAQAFGSTEITPEKIGLAIESFVLTLTSFDSKFDRAMKGETQLSEEEKRGFDLFMTEYDPRREQFGADCFHCHGGALFQNQAFANNGLDSEFSDVGRARINGKDSDAGKFSTPSLRNVAVTAPYMHDGRFNTLEEVIEHYATGVKRNATLDPNLAKHPDGGVPLSSSDKQALVSFLKTLTDPRWETPVAQVSNR